MSENPKPEDLILNLIKPRISHYQVEVQRIASKDQFSQMDIAYLNVLAVGMLGIIGFPDYKDDLETTPSVDADTKIPMGKLLLDNYMQFVDIAYLFNICWQRLDVIRPINQSLKTTKASVGFLLGRFESLLNIQLPERRY
jgi:hypothetical protein